MSCTSVFAHEHIPGVDGVLDTKHIHLDAVPKSSRTAREFARALALPLDDETGATLELLMSELVSNAVLHARTEAVLGISVTRSVVLVTVGDSDPTLPEQRPYALNRPNGRGMQLLHALAQQWGVTEWEGGKTVWFTVARVGGGTDE